MAAAQGEVGGESEAHSATVGEHAALDGSAGLLDFLQRLARVGAWEVDLRSGAFVATTGMAEFFGVAPERLPRTATEAHALASAESRAALVTAIEAVVARSDRAWSAELDVVRQDGRWIPVRVLGELEYADGRLARIRGVSIDIGDELRRRREQAERERAERVVAEQLRAQQLLEQRAVAERLERQNRALVAIATDAVVQDPADPERARRRLLEMAAEPLEVERVGLWWFEDDGRVLRCHGQYVRSARQHGTEPDVVMASYPRYHEALLSGRAIAAADARVDPHTDEFLPYLRERGITSMLDVPFRFGGKLAGVVCFEHVGPPRQWHADEVAFAAAVADHVAQLALHRERALALESSRRLATELEERVAHRTAALERANRELESFVYSVSHDLRAPLRAVDGFARALEEDAGPELDAEARGHIDRIRRAARRMDEMIDDLLRLSSVLRAPLALEDVDVSAMAASIVEQLRHRHTHREVECAIDAGLRVYADRGLLRIALENLLDNAWKFTNGRAVAHVRVTAGARPGELRVADDGVGFDPAGIDRLFQPFQRLHRDGDFPGTGIGLATVARIVHRHGGAVHADGRPGEGATFTLWLPPPSAREDVPMGSARP
jgi:signal transduction histidine kinase